MSSSPTKPARIHWSASDEGHTDCTFRYRGVTTTVRVLFEEPDIDIGGNQRSKDFTIEYMHEDMPNLTMGDQLTIKERDGTLGKFRVRLPPRVDEQRGMDGTYRCAVLTRNTGRDS